ncbi:hypothetical protein HDU96_003375, partial [Phlyctochytrium bullatum]
METTIDLQKAVLLGTPPRSNRPGSALPPTLDVLWRPLVIMAVLLLLLLQTLYITQLHNSMAGTAEDEKAHRWTTHTAAVNAKAAAAHHPPLHSVDVCANTTVTRTIYAAAVTAVPTAPPNTNATTLPAHLWTYWPTAHPPQAIRDNLFAWKRLHPSHTVTLATPATLHLLLTVPPPPGFEDANPSQQASWVRLALLQEHGGTYVDPTLLLTRPVPTPPPPHTALQFSLPHVSTPGTPRPLLSPWFHAAARGDAYTRAVFQELNLALANFAHPEHYLEHLRRVVGAGEAGGMVQRLGRPAVQVAVVCAAKVVEVDGVGPTPFVMGGDGEGGPLGVVAGARGHAGKVAEKV